MNQPNEQEVIFKEIEKFKKGMFWSNMAEIAAGIIVIPVLLIFAFKTRGELLVFPLGFLSGTVGVAFVIFYIIKHRMRKGVIPSKEDRIPYLRYWEGFYENTLKLARNIFWWYLLPLIPCFVLLTIGYVKTKPDKATFFLIIPAIVVFASVYWLNKYWVVKKYQPKIDRIKLLLSNLEAKP